MPPFTTPQLLTTLLLLLPSAGRCVPGPTGRDLAAGGAQGAAAAAKARQEQSPLQDTRPRNAQKERAEGQAEQDDLGRQAAASQDSYQQRQQWIGQGQDQRLLERPGPEHLPPQQRLRDQQLFIEATTLQVWGSIQALLDTAMQQARQARLDTHGGDGAAASGGARQQSACGAGAGCSAPSGSGSGAGSSTAGTHGSLGASGATGCHGKAEGMVVNQVFNFYMSPPPVPPPVTRGSAAAAGPTTQDPRDPNPHTDTTSSVKSESTTSALVQPKRAAPGAEHEISLSSIVSTLRGVFGLGPTTAPGPSSPAVTQPQAVLAAPSGGALTGQNPTIRPAPRTSLWSLLRAWRPARPTAQLRRRPADGTQRLAGGRGVPVTQLFLDAATLATSRAASYAASGAAGIAGGGAAAALAPGQGAATPVLPVGASILARSGPAVQNVIKIDGSFVASLVSALLEGQV